MVLVIHSNKRLEEIKNPAVGETSTETPLNINCRVNPRFKFKD
jgi:hypothetical protein